MKVKCAIMKSVELINWLDSEIGEPSVSSDVRTKASAASINLARQHQRAVVTLLDSDLPASAAAMLRVLNEAYLRAVWLWRCASASDIDSFLRDELNPSIGQVTSALEGGGFGNGVLGAMKDANWKMFCSYTHSGGLALHRQITSSVIEPNFSDDELVSMLRFTDAIGCMAALHFAVLADQTDLAKRVFEKCSAISGDARAD